MMREQQMREQQSTMANGQEIDQTEHMVKNRERGESCACCCCWEELAVAMMQVDFGQRLKL